MSCRSSRTVLVGLVDVTSSAGARTSSRCTHVTYHSGAQSLSTLARCSRLEWAWEVCSWVTGISLRSRQESIAEFVMVSPNTFPSKGPSAHGRSVGVSKTGLTSSCSVNGGSGNIDMLRKKRRSPGVRPGAGGETWEVVVQHEGRDRARN